MEGSILHRSNGVSLWPQNKLEETVGGFGLPFGLGMHPNQKYLVDMKMELELETMTCRNSGWLWSAISNGNGSKPET